MNSQDMVYMTNKVNKIGSDLDEVRTVVERLKLSQQTNLQANSPIPPGVYPKIAYDSKGLAIRGEDLSVSDIPNLPIDKIDGLRKLLDGLNQTRTITPKSIDSTITSTTTLRKKISPGTATKVNVNENGIVTALLELTQYDIPMLTMNHIEGLEERLEFLERLESSSPEKFDDINPGMYPKIAYNKDGRVVAGYNLSIEDIPISIINKLNVIEDKMYTFANNKTVEDLSIRVKGKVDSVDDVKPGIFTKVKVNDDGLVISGEPLTLRDLPEIMIRDIPNLEIILKNKVEQSDFIELMNTVSSISVSSTDIMYLKNQIGNKSEKGDVAVLNNQLSTMKKRVDDIVVKLPSESLTSEIRELKDLVHSLQGRVIAIEQNLS